MFFLADPASPTLAACQSVDSTPTLPADDCTVHGTIERKVVIEDHAGHGHDHTLTVGGGYVDGDITVEDDGDKSVSVVLDEGAK